MNRELFLEAVEFVSKAISGRMSLPIIECVQIVAKDGKATVTGTNLDLFASHTCPCEFEIGCCVPARRLMKFLALASADDVLLDEENGRLTITAGGAKAVLDTLPVDDFPPREHAQGEWFAIPSEEIKRALPAVSTEQTRYILMGVFLDQSGYVVATDHRRAHFTKAQKFPVSAIIPTMAARMLSGMDGKMCCDSKKFTAEGDGWVISGKLIEGNYPNWKNATAVKGREHLIPESFVDDINRAEACSSEQKERVVFGNKRIETDGFSEESELGIGFTLTVHPRYITEAIRAAGDGSIMRVSDGVSPLAIINGNFTGVVMPMRVTV